MDYYGWAVPACIRFKKEIAIKSIEWNVTMTQHTQQNAHIDMDIRSIDKNCRWFIIQFQQSEIARTLAVYCVYLKTFNLNQAYSFASSTRVFENSLPNGRASAAW